MRPQPLKAACLLRGVGSLALLAGIIEVLTIAVRRHARPMMHVSGDFAWMAPMALVLVAACATLAGLARIRAGDARQGAVVALFLSTAGLSLSVLLLIPGLSSLAAGMLASGAAVQIARTLVNHPSALESLGAPRLLVGLSLAATILAAGAWSAFPQPTPMAVPNAETSAPNVVVVTLDTVRSASTSLYGYSRPTTPALDRFAARGVVFDQAYATAPWTLPSHASMFTGRWPHELSADYDTPLDGTFPTLAEYLRGRGFDTAAFAANLGYVGFASGLGRGFDRYEDYPRSAGQFVSNSTLLRHIADNFALRRLLLNDEHLNRVSGADLNRRALAWLSTRDTDRPFFLFLNYFDAHEPYLPPPPFDRHFGAGRTTGKHSPLHHWLWNPRVKHQPLTELEVREERDAYDSAIAYSDARLGELLSALEDRAVLGNTVVVITSDHGEELGEHRLFDHGYSLYRASLQVPLVIVAPDRVPAGRRVTSTVSLRNLARTVVDVAGAGVGAPFPGESLARHWTDAPSPAVSPILSQVTQVSGQPDWFPASRGDMQSLVAHGHRYIRNGDGAEELYDAVLDPWEERNLAHVDEKGALLAEFRRTLEQLIAR